MIGMKRKSGKMIGVLFAYSLLIASLLGGCASQPPALTSEQAASGRALSYWNAIIAKDWERAYGFTSPGYRSAVDLFGYRRAHDGFVRYKQAKLVSALCDEQDVCKIKVQLTYDNLTDGWSGSVTTIEERWLRESGEWFRYVKR